MSENCNCGYPYGHARYCPLRSSVEYTPTVNAVREAYAGDRYPNVRIVPAYEEFDRMIAEVERAAVARALTDVKDELADQEPQAIQARGARVETVARALYEEGWKGVRTWEDHATGPARMAYTKRAEAILAAADDAEEVT